MMSRAASNSRWTSAMSAKYLHFKSHIIHGYKKESHKEKVGQVGGWYKTTFLFLAKNCTMLKAVWAGHCHGARTNPHSATSLDVLTGDHRVIVSTHKKLWFSICPGGTNSLCTIAATSKKEINIVLTLEWTCNALSLFFPPWVNSVTSTDWLLPWLSVIAIAPTLITSYNFCAKLSVIFELFLQITANIHIHVFCSSVSRCGMHFATTHFIIKYSIKMCLYEFHDTPCISEIPSMVQMTLCKDSLVNVFNIFCEFFLWKGGHNAVGLQQAFHLIWND